MKQFQLGDPIPIFDANGERLHDVEFDRQNRALVVIDFKTKEVIQTVNIKRKSVELRVSGYDLFINEGENKPHVHAISIDPIATLSVGVDKADFSPYGINEIAFFIGTEDFRTSRIIAASTLANNAIEIQIKRGVFNLKIPKV